MLCIHYGTHLPFHRPGPLHRMHTLLHPSLQAQPPTPYPLIPAKSMLYQSKVAYVAFTIRGSSLWRIMRHCGAYGGGGNAIVCLLLGRRCGNRPHAGEGTRLSIGHLYPPASPAGALALVPPATRSPADESTSDSARQRATQALPSLGTATG
jgi:hypothetical protein